MKIRDYLPTIGWRRLSRKEELAMKLDRFQKHEGLFVTWRDQSWCLHVRKVKEPTPPTNPPLAPA